VAAIESSAPSRCSGRYRRRGSPARPRRRHRADQLDRQLAGFGGPYLIGWVKEATGSTSTGLLVLAVLPLIAAFGVSRRPRDKSEFAADREPSAMGANPAMRRA